MKFNELDCVRVLVDFPEHGIKKGEIGTVVNVHTYKGETSYLVEFSDNCGRTTAMFCIPVCHMKKYYDFMTGQIIEDE